MTISVEVVSEVSDSLVEDLNLLLPQLSSTSTRLTHGALAEMVQSPSVTMFVARDDVRVVGTLTLVVFAIPTGRRAWIEDVVVDRSVRGTGVGQMLTSAAIERATDLGVRSIDLTSRPSREAANALYQKLGFHLRETNVYRYSLES